MKKTNVIKEKIKILLYRFHFKIVRVTNEFNYLENIDVVFDVGANVGQYGSRIRAMGFIGAIYSFEPLIEEHILLNRRAASDGNWFVEKRCALGANSKEVDLRVSYNSYSSSILDINSTHLKAEPNSKVISSIKTDLRTLDSFYRGGPYENMRSWLKIDVQGFEYEVLMGATDALTKIEGIQIELSTVELYVGQANFLRVFDLLDESGFVLVDIQNGFRDPVSGRLLQFDAFFLRK